MNLSGAKVVVVGMARSGVAAVELLKEKGATVTAVDQNPAIYAGAVAQTPAAFDCADLIVLSPGVPADIDVIAPARERGVRVIGDLELASWFLQGEIIGITGSNGKTTTTALTGHILQASGIPVQVGGNIGTPPCSMVSTSRADQWNVLEVSSFQLETTESFHARIGACLNVTPDHLDRHYTMQGYAEAKARLFVTQRAGDVAVLNADDEICRSYGGRGSASPAWFSSTHSVAPGAWLDGDHLLIDGEPLMKASEVPLRGVHNLENTMAAALMAREAGATLAQIREAVKTFPGVEHRIEFVRELNGVAYYNDSKATNVDATLKSIAAFPGGLWIILGGKDKNSDYTPLAAPLREKGRAALLVGAAAQKIEQHLNGALPVIHCATIDRAIREAHLQASGGETVLLAPACASFDQFQNYEHRGREFKRLVRELENPA
jgi:UDP-N-acetylmuramoylalanine--D-glutamate ligase